MCRSIPAARTSKRAQRRMSLSIMRALDENAVMSMIVVAIGIVMNTAVSATQIVRSTRRMIAAPGCHLHRASINRST